MEKLKNEVQSRPEFAFLSTADKDSIFAHIYDYAMLKLYSRYIPLCNLC